MSRLLVTRTRAKVLSVSVSVYVYVLFGALMLVFTPGCSTTAQAKKGRPLSHDEVAQVWIGLSEDELLLLRLELSPQGQGVGAYSFLDEEQHVFRISTWEYEKGRIYIAVEPADPLHWEIEPLRGSLIGDALHLTMSGNDWSRAFSLRREEGLLRRWSKLREAMEKFEAAE